MNAGVASSTDSQPSFKDSEQRRLGWSRRLGMAVAVVGAVAAPDWSTAGFAFSPAAGIGFLLAGSLLVACATRRTVRAGLASQALAALLLGWGTLCLATALQFPWPESFRSVFDRDELGMETLSAGCFMLLGAVSLGVQRAPARWLNTAHYGLLFILAVAYVGLIQLGYGDAIARPSLYTTMPPLSAALFAMTSIAGLLTTPQQGVMKLLASKDAGGSVTRRLVPLALLLIPLIDLLQARVWEPWGVDGIVIVGLMNVLVLLTIIGWTGNSLHRAEIDKRAAESAIEASEERLRIALVSAGGAAWDWDLDRDLAWWSPEMYHLWGIDPDTRMELANSLDVIDERDRKMVQDAVEEAIRTGSAYQSEFRVRGHRERWMISRGRVYYDAAGRPVRLIGITVDISDRKRMELALRESNAALERSNRELERFAHVASHDLQTPLRSIVGFAELLQARYPQELEREAQTWITRIVQSAEQLHAIVHDLLTYARIDTRAHPFGPISLQATLAQCHVLLDARIRESGAVIEAGELPTVFGDSSQLTQLFLNLIDNAIKYRGDAPPHIRIEAVAGLECWTLSFADNGIGIEERHRERIFEMFERLHRLPEYPGTGVGLAICRRVVQRHGGTIWVESQPRQGSVFHFTLPRLPL